MQGFFASLTPLRDGSNPSLRPTSAARAKQSGTARRGRKTPSTDADAPACGTSSHSPNRSPREGNRKYLSQNATPLHHLGTRYSTAVVAFVLSMSACSTPQPARDQTPRPPNAAEVFELRSKCATLGEVILENNWIGPALTQEVSTHYDERSNRCYAELDVHQAKLDESGKYYSRVLYDAQTKQVLAWTRSENGSQASSIFGPHVNIEHDTFEAANDRIDAAMKDER